LNTNKTKFEVINDAQRWNNLIHNDRFVIHSEYLQNGTMQVSYSEREEMHTGNGKTNVIIAAFTTCFARLKLYHELYKLGDRVAYVVRCSF
jgi:hypothetical protein